MAEQNTERAMPKYYPNDPCPCHSGKKYKHCCQKETARTRYLWEKFHAVWLDPRYVLESLTETAQKMTDFFNERMSQLKKPLFFALNAEEPCIVRTYDLGDAYLAVFQKMPVPMDFTMDAAHDLEKLLYLEADFPKAVVREDKNADAYLATSLNHMLSAPYIDSNILGYGFDMVSMLVHELQVQLPMLQNYPAEDKLSSYDRYMIGCLLTQQLLKWHLVDSTYTCPYIPVYQMKFPTILEECQKRFRFILDHGYDTPEKVRFLLNHFIQLNHLEDTLEVREA